jgi:hypothetical protein
MEVDIQSFQITHILLARLLSFPVTLPSCVAFESSLQPLSNGTIPELRVPFQAVLFDQTKSAVQGRDLTAAMVSLLHLDVALA